MKFKTFLLGMFLLAGTATAFAGVNGKAKEAKKEKAKTVKVVEPKKAKKDLFFGGCTATLETSKWIVTAIVTCTCTDAQACLIASAAANEILKAL